jgi:hypothetical protein
MGTTRSFRITDKLASMLTLPSLCSLLRNATDSTRIWKWLTVPLRALKLSWITSKSATGGDLVDDKRLKNLLPHSGIPISPASLSFVSAGILIYTAFVGDDHNVYDSE